MEELLDCGVILGSRIRFGKKFLDYERNSLL
jgi:hypothetical protein